MPEEKALKITMLGPTGVGKTTILAVMRREIDNYVSKNHTILRLNPGKPDDGGLAQQIVLGAFYDCEKQLSELKDKKNPTAQGGIVGTNQNTEFYFYISNLKGSKSSSKLLLEFQDYPGKWIEPKDSQRPTVVEYLKNSPITIIAIDTPALIEKDGQYHELINMTDNITCLLRDAYQSDNYQPQQKRLKRLVIFVPVKCEKYMQNNQTEIINVAIKKRYQMLLADLQQKIPTVAVAIIPIQTVGGVVFHEIVKSKENSEEKPAWNYRQNDNPEWETVNAEQPLRFILAFLLKNYLQDVQRGRGLFLQWIYNLLGSDRDLIEAITHFAESSVRLAGTNGNGIELIQGEDLLTVN